ncbi:hypothetical protein HPB51_021976 [Rhipicephalus microplus]|uniref:Uncharacterized protein n=1 Tax=Rhipicephalus microplus TaxID=6941 RepID=A0A9J6DWZ7_RHIMP|nr:hypothetical protein HPB51_021976 [Rhipicephalus microplus]
MSFHPTLQLAAVTRTADVIAANGMHGRVDVAWDCAVVQGPEVDLEQKTRSGSSPQKRASTLQAPEALFDRNSKKTKLTTPKELDAVYYLAAEVLRRSRRLDGLPQENISINDDTAIPLTYNAAASTSATYTAQGGRRPRQPDYRTPEPRIFSGESVPLTMYAIALPNELVHARRSASPTPVPVALGLTRRRSPAQQELMFAKLLKKKEV